MQFITLTIVFNEERIPIHIRTDLILEFRVRTVKKNPKPSSVSDANTIVTVGIPDAVFTSYSPSQQVPVSTTLYYVEELHTDILNLLTHKE